ncbi:MAG: transporter substrate-binding domain-containing protein [Deltaproteobacteria bacterium]|nr:transporter substrate-binding domain-containing protein [Deltaproteobacteria bacterium]MBI3388124.1 transporter substrate-binding domain-containing protein [Deltaproteobacteria bacterium]
MKRFAATIGMALVALSVVSGCHHETSKVDGIPTDLRVGIAPVYPPLAFKDHGELKGVEADFAHMLAPDLKIKVTLVELTWDELIPALVDGRIDVIMSGMSITEERSKLVTFTQPYLRVGQMALIRRADYNRYRDYATFDLPATRVGYHTDTTGELYVRRKLAHATLRGFDSPEAGIAALRAGDIDVFIHDAPTIWRVTGGFEKKDPELIGRYRMLTEEYLAWAVRKGDEPLRERLNSTLLHWQNTDQVETELDKWIPVRKVSLDLKAPK